MVFKIRKNLTITLNKNNINHTQPQKNKYRSSLSLYMLLISSALATPASGMVTEWSDLFNSKKSHYQRVLGTKILKEVDNRSLGRAAQVNHDWQRLVYEIREQKLLLEKQQLYSLILEVTEVEPNQVQQLHDLLETKKELKDPFVISLLALKKRLLQPEALIRANEALINDFLLTPKLEAHVALKPLKALIKDLEHTLTLETTETSLKAVGMALKNHYEAYLSRLLLPECNRALHICPKALLSGEGFLGDRQGITSYRLSQEMARDLLSRDEYGLVIKKNTHGVHAVCFKASQVKSCGVHFKGDTAKSDLLVGRESAVYALSQVLFNQGSAASALISLHNVDIKTPLPTSIAYKSFEEARQKGQTSEDFFTLYPAYEKQFTKREPSHVLQASNHVEGLSLESFIKERGNTLKNYEDVDLDSFSEQILLSILINPTDGKPDNFILKKRGNQFVIIGIDNDMALEVGDVVAEDITSAFIPGQKITKTKKRSVRVKNILYCLPLMDQVLSIRVAKRIMGLSPDLLALEWLHLLKEQDTRYRALQLGQFSLDNHDQTLQAYLSESQYKTLQLPFKLDPNFIPEITQTLRNIQVYLHHHPAATHWQLLLNSRPLSARFYQEMMNKRKGSLLEAYVDIHPQPDPLGKPPKAVPYLEDLLSLEEKLLNGQTVGEVLSRITTRPDGSHAMTQSITDAAQDLLSRVNVGDAPYGFLKTAIQSFEEKIRTQEGTPLSTLHPSWLNNSTLFRALEEGISNKELAFLLKLGHNVTLRDPHTQQNALHYALEKKYPLDFLKLLLKSVKEEEQATLLNGLDHQGLTPLDHAMEHGDKDSFCHLRALGALKCSASIALKFYKRKVISQVFLHQPFRDLMALNGEIEWLVSLEELLPPLTSKKDAKGVPLVSSTYGERQLPDIIKNQIFDKENHFIQVSTLGNHPVTCAHKQGPLKTHGLYFKLYPALPGLEEAAGGLTRQLLGFGAPYTDLVKLGTFPALISQEIPGDTLLKVLKTNPTLLKSLDEKDISGMLVAAILTNPEDGKPDNYIVTPHPTKPNKFRIVGIDNDQAFVPAIVKEAPDKSITGKIRPIAQVKTILYCLDQMKSSIHLTLRTTLINTHPDRFLESWLRALKRINNQHCGLFTGPEQAKAFQDHKCFIGVPFQQGSIRHIYEKFVQLRDLLTLHPHISHIDLLSKLEPRLAKRYQAALTKDISVEERFRTVDRPFYEVKTDSKKGESHTTVTQSGDILQSMGIPLQEKIFDSIRLGKESCPVQALLELDTIKREKNTETLKALAARVGDINLLKTLTLEESRVLFLKELEKQNKRLVPTEQVAILEYLATQKGIRDLILPNFFAIDDTLFQKLNFEHLRKLDVRKCMTLTNGSLVHLSKTALPLEELNLSSNPQLKEVGAISVFTDAPLIFNVLRYLNLSHCTNLIKVLIQAPKLHYLNIENCSQLNDQMLDGVIEHSPNLQKLVFESCPLVGEREMREKYPYFAATYWKNVNKKDPILKILESKGSELKFSEKEIDTSPQGLMIFEKALKINIHLSNLKELDLSNNYIGDTGAKSLSQGNLLGLTSLNLDRNKIGDEGAKVLSQGNLTGLTTLTLYGNNIGETGAKYLSQGNLKGLKELNLDYNKIGETGAKFLATGNLKGLKELDLVWNNIGETGAKFLATGNLLVLTSLDLNSNKIGDAGAKYLSQGNLTGLKELSLDSNKIGETGAKFLATGNLTSLKELQLGDNKIREIGAKFLSQGNLTSLKKLNLWSNNIGETGAKFLSQGNLTGLTWLYLTNNNIGETGAKFLSQGNLTSLTWLYLYENNIGETGAKFLSQGNLTGLTSLGLSSNNIGDTGAKYLSQGNLLVLTSVDLSWNKIGETGVSFLSNGSNLTALTTLDLGGNKIGNEGVKTLANGNFSTLTKLQLFYLDIGVEGVKYLTTRNLSALTALNLQGNKIGDEGAKVLSQGNLTNLTSLTLYENNIGDAGAKYLSQGNLTDLTSLSLDKNNIGEQGKKALKERYPNAKIDF